MEYNILWETNEGNYNFLKAPLSDSFARETTCKTAMCEKEYNVGLRDNHVRLPI